MLMLLVLRVLGLLLIPALIGQIKQIARNGMHTEDVAGLLVILVLFIMVTNLVVNQLQDVLGSRMIVHILVHMMNIVVLYIVDVLGQTILEIVHRLMNLLVPARYDVLQAMIIVIITLMEAEMGQLVQL